MYLSLNLVRMKNVFALSLLLIITSFLVAQAPQGIPYQAVMRNADGTVMSSSSVNLTFMIHDGSATGTIVFEETHALTSNNQGLVSCVVGNGVVSQGNFSNINWGSGAKFLHVMMGTTDLGTQQMLSVPYALYAGSASAISSSTSQLIIGVGFTTISNSTFNGNLMESISYCFNLEEANYSDWRLPDLEEVFNYVTLNGVSSSQLNLWTMSNANYNILGPQGSIFPFTCFNEGQILVDSPYSVRLTRCVR